MMKKHPKAKTLMWSCDDNVYLDGVGGVGWVKTNADTLIKMRWLCNFVAFCSCAFAKTNNLQDVDVCARFLPRGLAHQRPR